MKKLPEESRPEDIIGYYFDTHSVVGYTDGLIELYSGFSVYKSGLYMARFICNSEIETDITFLPDVHNYARGFVLNLTTTVGIPDVKADRAMSDYINKLGNKIRSESQIPIDNEMLREHLTEYAREGLARVEPMLAQRIGTASQEISYGLPQENRLWEGFGVSRKITHDLGLYTGFQPEDGARIIEDAMLATHTFDMREVHEKLLNPPEAH